jgi:hypothetical protein
MKFEKDDIVVCIPDYKISHNGDGKGSGFENGRIFQIKTLDDYSNYSICWPYSEKGIKNTNGVYSNHLRLATFEEKNVYENLNILNVKYVNYKIEILKII